ncbi:hypothetical protein Natpe_0706 [Natrinema pellirubrum DSM 15624]|nr:hypothetical protein [Natrinema pellirubrum]AGB30630.1 hypothetical protein Natpe_0706 [Natrinema pellirubrum DSM 15624]
MATPSNPGIDVVAAVGLYVAAVAVGLVALGGVATGASSDALVALVPTAFTTGLLCGVVVARVTADAVVRLGAWRWRTVACWAPASLVAGGAVVLSATGAVSRGWRLLLLGGASVAVVLSGWLLSRTTRDAYVGAAIDDRDDMLVDWTWYQSGTHAFLTAIGLALFGVGTAASLAVGTLSYRFLLPSIVLVVLGWAPTLSVPTPGGDDLTLFSVTGLEGARADVRAYPDGIVVEPRLIPSYRWFVPWDRIVGVRTTADRLVFERRWRPAVRCDRSAIEDAEAVRDAIERARRGTVDSQTTI